MSRTLPLEAEATFLQPLYSFSLRVDRVEPRTQSASQGEVLSQRTACPLFFITSNVACWHAMFVSQAKVETHKNPFHPEHSP